MSDKRPSVEVKLSWWMIKQLRGTARHEKRTARTPAGKRDWAHIEHALTAALEDARDS